MKKLLLAGLLGGAVFGLSANVLANVNHNNQSAGGGFASQTAQVVSVSNANNQPDDSRVIIEGFIIRNISHNLYEFKDDSGITRVKIDKDKWDGLIVSPDTKIRIEGRIDNHLIDHEINAEKIYPAE
ncbi:TPA: NirD/YgiW/YdeI family stress tolerance protein [Morganella morganii subsp. morganii]|uniref:TIGR00156 family protein n=1 Tax=Morganella morganii TaxID=582 RepID=A0AAU8ZMU9_MORMO|nr:NirD/YgiW/YdeI family stress tolerance protein [Morganella morganii]AWC94363.1 TIGR00156 family protein [Morganella morganii]EKW8485439.1 NirD/YgiW/YdeI family stress tolerance protein [Morganella morganii]HAT3625655.1 NirD/YgiW/YdeI family stress tolerance protein [Morganella morganii]HDU8692643.1 NirD/YgiW/YdeI family stress tolerance protein [Morganella morganii subsp. morganii]